MVGMIVGAGIFSVPYVFVRSGVLIGVLTTILVFFVIRMIHNMYADITIVTQGRYRLVGIASEFLGFWPGKVASLIVMMSGFTALLSYTLLGGIFLNALFGSMIGGGVVWYQLVFLALGGLSLSFGAKLIGSLNSVLTLALIFLFVVLIAVAGYGVFIPNLTTVFTSHLFGVYGVMLFSLLGVSAVPEMYMLLGNKAPLELRSTVKLGTIIATAITLLFGVAVAGFNGPYTTSDAITGLAAQLGTWVLVIGAVLGLLTVFTSFIILALSLDETCQSDFGWSSTTSLLFSFAPVLACLVFGFTNLVAIMSFSGTVFGGGICIVVALAYRKILRDPILSRGLTMKSWAPIVSIICLIVGMAASSI